MFRYLASIGILLALASSVVAQPGRPPAAVVLRETKPDGESEGFNNAQAILLDSHANELASISGLGVIGSLSNQNSVLIDVIHDRILFAERLHDRLSAFNYDGTLQLRIPIDNADAIVLTDDATLIGCVVAGKTINELQTAFLDATTGKEIRRLNWGGLALVNDVDDSQFWAVGKQVIAFDAEGQINVRRPLTQLPAEPDHPTVINSRNWCAIGVTVEPNKNSWMRRVWVIERDHPDVNGSKNRLFAVDSDGQTCILVELQDIDPRSVTCATYQGDLTRILVVDGATGDLVSFNCDGELMRRYPLNAHLVAFGKDSGLWVAGRKSIMRLDPSDLSVVAEHSFDQEAEPLGLAVR